LTLISSWLINRMGACLGCSMGWRRGGKMVYSKVGRGRILLGWESIFFLRERQFSTQFRTTTSTMCFKFLRSKSLPSSSNTSEYLSLMVFNNNTSHNISTLYTRPCHKPPSTTWEWAKRLSPFTHPRPRNSSRSAPTQGAWSCRGQPSRVPTKTNLSNKNKSNNGITSKPMK